MGHLDVQRWIAPLLLVLWGAGGFWDGFYAPGQQLVAVGLVALLALAVRAAAPLGRLEAAALLLVAVGVALSLRSPASAGTAAHGPAVAAGWVLALVAGRALAGRQIAEPLLARFWAMAGALMAFAGMAAISSLPLHHSGRLASFLGYPVAVGVLGLLGLTGSLPDLAAGHRWAPLLALGNGLAVLLSGSRGVWAVGALLAAGLAWAAPGLLRRAGRPLLLALAVALAAALWAAPAVSRQEPGPLVLIALIALLTVAWLIWFQPGRPWLLAAGVAWAASLALAPGWGWLLGRATALPLSEGSSVERLTMLQDGWRLVTSHPWGAGYRGWNALHLQAASYGYYSAEVHSAPLDLTLAFGWAGGLGFLLLLGRFLFHLRQSRGWSDHRLAVLAGLGALAVHALLDWDLSYGFFALPLWFGFGLAAGPPGPLRWPAWLTVGLAGLTLAGAALLGAGDLFTAQAGRSLARGEPGQARLHARMAVAATPWNDLSHAYLGQANARLGRADRAIESLVRARRLGPREPWYAQLLARELAARGRWLEAAAAWREGAALWPWHLPAYEEALQGHVDLIRRAEAAGRPDLVRELARSGRAILEQLVRQKGREPERMPRRPLLTSTPAIEEARLLFAQILDP